MFSSDEIDPSNMAAKEPCAKIRDNKRLSFIRPDLHEVYLLH